MQLFDVRLARNIALAAALLLCTGASANLGAAIIFSDNFDDGDVTDWTKTTNYGGTTVVTVRTDSVVSPDYALHTYLEPPPDGFDLIVRGSHGFTTVSAADHTLSLWARSVSCSGCAISYDVLVDGVLLDRENAAPDDYEFRSFTLSGLAPGAHTLALGIHTDIAHSGRFSASFDDVLITGPDPDPDPNPGQVPEPATIALTAAGLALAALRRKRCA